jgi:hypothetical protein
MLDRLGISSGGGGGGRRRAPAADESVTGASVKPVKTGPVNVEPSVELVMTGPVEVESPVEPVRTGPVKAEPPVEPPQTESWLPAAVEPPKPPVREGPPARAERLTDDEYRDQVADPWLPRLRLPPPLEPLDEQGLGWLTSDNYGGSTDDLGAPFADSYARAIAEDEPPPDAGLAELLARALAEHQAGTASAAALFKRLGTERHEPGERRPVNGHGRSGESPDNGFHRTGE